MKTDYVDDENITVEMLFNWIEIETRVRQVGNNGIGEGRKTETDRDGKKIVGPWIPTGAILHNYTAG